jgi:N-acetylglucosaminyldiphosphoundecaprenol N-acetyl-beta-D-mannosaminyltransferase
MNSEGEIDIERHTIFGVTLDNLTYDEFCKLLDDRIASRKPGYVVTPNVDHVCRVAWDDAFRKAYANAFLVVADGTIVIWAARLLGVRIKEKLSGSDLVPRLSAHAATRGYRVFFLGAIEGVAAEAAAKLQAKHPGFAVAGIYSPPFGFEKDPVERERIASMLAQARADFCFVALGSPKQEVWMAQCAQVLGTPLLIGIGASLDFAAGRVKRAPRLFQVCGLEWMWRLALEPRRLWRRYLIDDLRFVSIFAREAAARLIRAKS